MKIQRIKYFSSMDHTKRLFNLCVSHEDNLGNLRRERTEIADLFQFNSDRKKDLEELTEKLNKGTNERERIIGSSSIGADKLIDVLKNYNGWQRDLLNHNKELLEYDKDAIIEAELNQKLQKR